MKITVSKSCQTLQQKSRLRFQQQRTVPDQPKCLPNHKQKKFRNHGLKTESGKNDYNDNHGFFSNCLPCPSQKDKDLSKQFQIGLPQHIRYNKQKAGTNQVSIVVSKAMSNQDNEQRHINFTRKLGKKIIVDQQKRSKIHLQQSVDLAKKQPSYDNKINVDRQATILSSQAKQQVKSQPSSIIYSTISQTVSLISKKINLTVSRKSKQEAGQLVEAAEKDKLEIQNKENQPCSVIKINEQTLNNENQCYKTQNDIKVSQNEFKIDDPLAELKSLNTEYLKNKIAFSSVQSERQELHYQISESIFCTHHRDITSSLIKENKSQCRGQQFGPEFTRKKQGFSQSKQNYLQQSIVLQEKVEDLFDFVIPPFRKLAKSEGRPFNYNFS